VSWRNDIEEIGKGNIDPETIDSLVRKDILVYANDASRPLPDWSSDSGPNPDTGDSQCQS
jgi:hypothetical protein